jgi:hypothetical protein
VEKMFGADWAEYEDYIFGGDTFQDGQSYADAADYSQMMYGIAFEVDEDTMEVQVDAKGYQIPFDAVDAMAGGTGYYTVANAFIWYSK